MARRTSNPSPSNVRKARCLVCTVLSRPPVDMVMAMYSLSIAMTYAAFAIPKTSIISKKLFWKFEMPSLGTPTIDQLNVFLCVAETGSFTGAGRRLKRATSAITYAIDQLELQLGLALFDRSGTRKPELTEAGRVLLSEA